MQLNKFNAQYATIYLPLVNHPWCKPIRPNNSTMYSPPGRKIHASVVVHLLRQVCHPTNTCLLEVVYYSPNSTSTKMRKHHCCYHHCVVNGISIVIRCIRHYGGWLDRGSSMCRSLLMVTLVAVSVDSGVLTNVESSAIWQKYKPRGETLTWTARRRVKPSKRARIVWPSVDISP